MRKYYTKLMVAIGLSCISLAFATSNQAFFSGYPTYQALDSLIIKSQIFQKAPKPKIDMIHYQAQDVVNNSHYSDYTIRLHNTTNKFTAYRTTEITGENKQLKGFGIGYGGIFSIAYKKRGDLARYPNYFIQYQWDHISHVKGHIFPLQVGNQLTFHYQDRVRHQPNAKPQIHRGKIRYQVLRKQQGYNSGLTQVPGPIYVIKFSQSTENHPMRPQNIYYFSTQLGWYVYAEYFFDQQVKAKYRVQSYQLKQAS